MQCTKIICAAVVAFALTGVAAPAMAQVSSTIPVTLTGADPVAAGYHFDEGQPCNVHTGLGGNRAYQTKTVNVAATGTYTLSDQGPGDIGFALYTGSFDPLNPTVGCVASTDGAINISLTSGNYTLVQMAWSNGALGNFSSGFNGPGAVTTVAAAAIPTLSEWAMILFGTILAGGAALYVQRRRLPA